MTITKVWGVIRDKVSRIIVIVILTIMSLTALFPLYFILVNAFKGQAEYVVNQLGLPKQPVLSSFEQAFKGREIPLWFINSAVITIAVVIIVMLLGSLSAYAFARMQFRGKEILFTGIISLMVVPPVLMIIPLFVLMVNIHLVNTYPSVILVYVGILLPFTIYMLKSFFVTVSTGDYRCSHS